MIFFSAKHLFLFLSFFLSFMMEIVCMEYNWAPFKFMYGLVWVAFLYATITGSVPIDDLWNGYHSLTK
jgi:hypothetical protein